MKQEKIKFQETLEFTDEEKNLVKCEIEIKEKSRKRQVFSMSGEYCGSSGQCFDHVKPRTEAQKKLIEIWNTWHLNDIRAGTKEQEEALKKCKSKNYDDRVKFLKKHRKYTVRLKNGKRYKYGSEWIYDPLPKGFEKELQQIITTIKHEEQQQKELKTLNSAVKSFDDLGDDKITALALHLQLTPAEAEDITSDGDIYSYQGEDYFIGTDKETEDECKEYLTDDDSLWKSAVQAGNTTEGLDDWADDVIKSDGYGHILNSYDGGEDTQDVNGTTYYVIRR